MVLHARVTDDKISEDMDRLMEKRKIQNKFQSMWYVTFLYTHLFFLSQIYRIFVTKYELYG